jgi:hypothetical protein
MDCESEDPGRKASKEGARAPAKARAQSGNGGAGQSRDEQAHERHTSEPDLRESCRIQEGGA